MLYEMRIYDAVPGKFQALHDRFANITLRFFEKHGIRVVAFWEHVIGVSNQLIYVLAWQDLAERERVWGAFASDPEWLKARAETERDGPLVAKITNYILKPTPYSPMQ